MNLLICLETGVDQDFLQRYVHGQLGYASESQSPLPAKVRMAVQGFREVDRLSNGSLGSLVVLSLALAPTALLLLSRRRARPGHRDRDGEESFVAFSRRLGISLGGLSLLVLAGAAAIVVVAGQFHHYYLLLLFPAGALAGGGLCVICLLIERRRARVIVAVVFVLAGTATLAADLSSALWVAPWDDERVVPPPRLVLGTQRHRVSDAVLRYASPGERMVIWGWMDQYFVETRLVPATRTRTEFLFRNLRNIDHYIDSMVSEMARAEAPVLLDAVAPGSFYLTDRRLAGMHVFPPIASHVRQHYVRVETVDGVDIYLSRARHRERLGDGGPAPQPRDQASGSVLPEDRSAGPEREPASRSPFR
jgi:hypothetical protein